MSITVRHTLFALAAVAGLCANVAAQMLTDLKAPNNAARDVASAASLEVAPPAENLIPLESADDVPPRIDAHYTAGDTSAVQDTHDIDEPPVKGDVDDQMTDGEKSNAAHGADTRAAETIVADGPGEYVEDDWVHEDDASFAELISSGTWLHRGRWFSQMEASLVNRSTAPRQVLSDVPLIFSGQTFFSDAMTTESAGFGYEPGLRVTVGKFLGRDGENRDRTLEFTYWGLNEWTSQHAVAAVNPTVITQLLRTPLDRGIGAFNFATRHAYSYESDLNSFEINAKIARRLGRDRLVLRPDGRWERQCDPGRTPTFLAGFRTIHIGEAFSFTAERPAMTVRNQTNTADVNLPAASGLYDIGTQNRLFGLQLGAELYNQHCQFSWGVRGKIGGYANFVEQDTTVRVTDTQSGLFSSTRDESATDVQMTLGCELGLVGTYQFRPNVALRCSYDFIYLQGLALAPQQLDFNAAPQPNVRSGAHQFLNGGSVGLEIVW